MKSLSDDPAAPAVFDSEQRNNHRRPKGPFETMSDGISTCQHMA